MICFSSLIIQNSVYVKVNRLQIYGVGAWNAKNDIDPEFQELINESGTMDSTSLTENYPESCSFLRLGHSSPDGILSLMRDILTRRKNETQVREPFL